MLGHDESPPPEAEGTMRLDGEPSTDAELGHAADAAALLQGLAPRWTEDADAAQVLNDVAVLRLHALRDAKGALEAARDAFRRSPSHHIARAYRTAAERAGSVEDQLLALESEARSAAQPAHRAALETERGRLLERAGNAPGARQAYAAAVETHPAELLALHALLRLGERDAEAAIHACRGIADAVTDPRVKAEYLARGARLCDAAGRADAAMMMGVQAAVHAPASPSVRFLLERLYAAAAQHKELAALLETEVADGTAPALESWFEIGLLARYALDDAVLAAQAFGIVVEQATDASREVALAELAALHARAGRWTEAVAAEEQLAAGETTALGKAIGWTRAGVLRDEQLNDVAGAAEAYSRALEAMPAHLPALEGAGRAYAKLGAVDRLLAIHRAEAEHAPSPADRAGALRRAGELLIADPARVGEGIELLDEALRAAPGHAGIFAALERALRKSASYARLCDLYERELARVTVPRRRAWLLLQIGGLAADRLEDPRRAIAAFRGAAEIPEGAPDQALTRLAQLLEDRGELAELEPVLARLRSMTDDAAQAASLAERAALLQEARGDLDAAVETYAKALGDAPLTHTINASAGRAFARAGRWDAVLKLWERSASAGEEPERIASGYKVGVVLARRFDRVDDAIVRLEAVRALAPRHVATITMLCGLYEEKQRWSELRSILADLPPTPARLARRAALAEQCGKPEEALQLWDAVLAAGAAVATRPRLRLLAQLGRWKELGAAYAARAEQAAGAAREHAGYRAAEIALEREHDGARASALLDAAVAASEASVAVLFAKLRATGDEDPQRRRLLGLVLALVQDPMFRAALFAQIANSTHATEAEVIAALMQQLALSPRDPIATARIEQTLERHARRRETAAALTSQLNDARLDAGVAASVAVRLGMLLQELGAYREAADSFERALAFNAPMMVARLALPRLYAALGDARGHLAALRGLASALPVGRERAAVLRALAAQQRSGGDGGAAATTLEAALQAYPRDFDALRELETLVRDHAPARLIDPLLRAWSAEPAGPQRQQIGVALAVRQLRAGRHVAARETIDRVLADDPELLRAQLLRAEAEAEAGGWAAVADACGRVAAHPEAGAELRIEALRRLAGAQLDRLEDLPGASATATRLRELAPGDRSSLEIALRVAVRAADHKEIAAVLAALAAHEQLTDEERADHQLQLATVQEVHLDDTGAAIATLGAVRLPAKRRDAVDRLLDLGGKTGRWDLAATALEQTLDRGGDMEPVWEVAIRTRLAHLLEGPLQRAEAAVRQYERIVAIEPGNIPALERLAELSVGTPEKIVEYHRSLLRSQPGRITSYRALRQTFLAMGDEDGAFLVEALLEGAGAADEEESYFYKQRRARLTGAIDGTLGDRELWALFPEADAPGFAVLRALAPALSAVFPADFASYGITAGDAPHAGPCAEVAERLARLFGVAQYRLLAVPNRFAACVEPAVPPILLVPRALDEATPREQAATLATLMSRAAFDGAIGDARRVSAISPTLLEYLLWAACEIADPAIAAPSKGKAVYEDVKRRLQAALPAGARAPLADSAGRLAAHGVQGEPLLAAMERASLRAAILAAQDPVAAIARLDPRDRAGARGLDTLPPALLAVLPFTVSTEHLAMRKRLQIGVAP